GFNGIHFLHRTVLLGQIGLGLWKGEHGGDICLIILIVNTGTLKIWFLNLAFWDAAIHLVKIIFPDSQKGAIRDLLTDVRGLDGTG
ncbi:MAG: hypothetical protein LBI02_04630, partial [Opitutaceae bacterium]|nr:hypothetical protein [Opitutaceae bacterium]